MSNDKRAAFEYADNLKEPWRSDPVVRGMVEEAFIAGRIIRAWPPIADGGLVWSCKCGYYDLTVDYNNPPDRCASCGIKTAPNEVPAHL